MIRSVWLQKPVLGRGRSLLELILRCQARSGLETRHRIYFEGPENQSKCTKDQIAAKVDSSNIHLMLFSDFRGVFKNEDHRNRIG